MSEPNVQSVAVPGLGPSFSIGIAPNGYIRVVMSDQLLFAQFYVDGQTARALAKFLVQAADGYDDVWSRAAGQVVQAGQDVVGPAIALVRDVEPETAVEGSSGIETPTASESDGTPEN